MCFITFHNNQTQITFITYSPTPTEPWLAEASGSKGESRDVTNLQSNQFNRISAIVNSNIITFQERFTKTRIIKQLVKLSMLFIKPLSITVFTDVVSKQLLDPNNKIDSFPDYLFNF